MNILFKLLLLCLLLPIFLFSQSNEDRIVKLRGIPVGANISSAAIGPNEKSAVTWDQKMQSPIMITGATVVNAKGEQAVSLPNDSAGGAGKIRNPVNGSFHDSGQLCCGDLGQPRIQSFNSSGQPVQSRLTQSPKFNPSSVQRCDSADCLVTPGCAAIDSTPLKGCTSMIQVYRIGASNPVQQFMSSDRLPD